MRRIAMVLVLSTGMAQAEEGVVILSDEGFQNGFQIVHPTTRKVCATAKSTPEGPEPVWQIVQWRTRFNLETTLTRRPLEDGGIVFEDETKSVEFHHKDGLLVLGLDSIKEFDGVFRKQSQGWPHLLVQQNFQSPFLGEFDSLNLSLEAKIPEARNIEDPDKGYDPGRHASQFQIYFIVKDDKPDSPGRHDFYWHGVPLYDSRHPYHEESFQVDFNPDLPESARRGIYVPSSRAYFGDRPSLHRGEWVRLEAGLLPLIRQGLSKAKAQGALANSPATLDAYRIAHVNIGWEIPGLAKAKGAIRHLSLIGRKK